MIVRWAMAHLGNPALTQYYVLIIFWLIQCIELRLVMQNKSYTIFDYQSLQVASSYISFESQGPSLRCHLGQ